MRTVPASPGHFGSPSVLYWMPTRRIFLVALLTCCSRAESAVRLRARPAKVVGGGDAGPGVTPLNLRPVRDALLYVPDSVRDPDPLRLRPGCTVYRSGLDQGVRPASSGRAQDRGLRFFRWSLLRPWTRPVQWRPVPRGDRILAWFRSVRCRADRHSAHLHFSRDKGPDPPHRQFQPSTGPPV